MASISAVQKATQLWQGLNERQQTWLVVIYRADQAAEKSAKGAWTRGERSRPASEWRWLDYGIVDDPLASGPSGELQRQLNQRKVWDQGAGATMGVLLDQGLIKVKRVPLTIASQMLIQLTKLGRAVARAGGADDTAPARQRPAGMLTETFWSMLVDVHRAGEKGLLRVSPSGGWKALAERDPALLSIGPDVGSYKSRITLAPAGVQHYADQWREYAKLYPGVAAPNPDSAAEPVWPREVDAQLRLLAGTVTTIGQDLHAIGKQRRELPEPPAAPGKSTLPELAAAVKLQRERHRLDLRVQTMLGEHHEQLLAVYRGAVARYTAVAAAVVTASAEGRDPQSVLDVGPVVLDERDRLQQLECPRTGLAGVDREIAVVHRAAVKGAKAARRREDRDWEERVAVAGRQLEAVRAFAEHLRELVADGQLTRLLLRRDDG